MFYPYCTVNETEIVHTPLNSAGQTLVHIEEPSDIYCFKTMDCLIPTYVVSNVIGFTREEVSGWVDFCRHNAGILLNCAKQGGIANADYI